MRSEEYTRSKREGQVVRREGEVSDACSTRCGKVGGAVGREHIVQEQSYTAAQVYIIW